MGCLGSDNIIGAAFRTVVLICCMPQCRIYAARILKGPVDASTLWGESASFSCEFDTYVTSRERHWSTPLFDIVNEDSLGTQFKNYRLLFSLVAENRYLFTLVITSVEPRDKGRYECIILGTNRDSAVLHVDSRSRAVTSSSPVVLGTTVTLSCQFASAASTAAGSERRWQLVDNTYLNAVTALRTSRFQVQDVLATNTMRLTIRSIQRTDIGEYMCEDGDKHKVIKLSSFELPKVMIRPSDVKTRAGDTITLECRIYEGTAFNTANATISWVRVNHSDSSVLSTSKVYSFELSIDSSGEYACRVYIPEVGMTVTSEYAKVYVEEFSWGVVYILLGVIIAIAVVTPAIVLCLRSADPSVKVETQSISLPPTGDQEELGGESLTGSFGLAASVGSVADVYAAPNLNEEARPLVGPPQELTAAPDAGGGHAAVGPPQSPENYASYYYQTVVYQAPPEAAAAPEAPVEPQPQQQSAAL